jgi:hypothetical protein
MDITKILEIAAVVYGVMAAIVKFCPTIPDKGLWSVFLFIVKLLGKLTNNQTDDDKVREGMK